MFEGKFEAMDRDPISRMGDGSFFLEIGNERVELPGFWDFLLWFWETCFHGAHGLCGWFEISCRCSRHLGKQGWSHRT